MREVFRTAPIRVARSHHRSDARLDGTAYFVATVYEPEEQTSGDPSCDRDDRSASYWRSSMRPGEPLRVSPAFDGLPMIEIPRPLVDALPDEARLRLSWIWIEVGLQPGARAASSGGEGPRSG